MRDEPTKGEGFLLSGVAGAVDGLGFLLLHVFTAHITGNTVHLGNDAGRLDPGAAARPALAIAAFVGGVALGALTREACARRGLPARPAVLALTAALLVAFLAIGVATAGAHSEAIRFCAMTAPAALAMGCQNAVMPTVGGQRVRTYITGTMTELAEALVSAARSPGGARREALRRAAGLLGVWAAYLTGGVSSSIAGARWGAVAALLPIAGLALAMGVGLRRWRAVAPESRPRA